MIVIALPTSSSSQTKYRLSYRFMVIHTLIAIISPRMIGLIDARTSNNNHSTHQHNNLNVVNNSDSYSYETLYQGNMMPMKSASKEILQRGHSHNDYHQKYPLQSALLHGLRSVEVDVFPFDGELFVAHTRLELDESKTIGTMYINPLLDVLKLKRKGILMEKPFPFIPSKRNYSKTILSPYQHQYKLQRKSKSEGVSGSNLIDPHDDSLILLVDFKADPNLSAKLLNKAIKPLKPYLSKVKNGEFHKGRVTVIVSGNRPTEENLFDESGILNNFDKESNTSEENEVTSTDVKVVGLSRRPFGFAKTILQKTTDRNPSQVETLLDNEERFLFIDGRVNDLYEQKSTSMYPLISLNWTTIQFYRLLGKGKEFVKECTDLAHSQGKRLRIWGAPNNEAIWRFMMRNNVDWLSIDDHDRFARFAMKSG